jgi:hypothetical protein
VGEDEREHKEAVPPMPHGQTVEADGPFEERQPGQQQHLDQREVPGKKRGQSPEPDEACVEGVPVEAEPVGTSGTPDPDDPGCVADQEQPEREPRQVTPGRAPEGSVSVNAGEVTTELMR